MSSSSLRALIHREFVRVLRQPTRIVATLGTAGIFWLLAASGFADALRLPEGTDAAYSAYLLPGIAMIVVMFGTIFGAITLIQDRHSGFLQSVLVSPVPLWVVATSKLLPAAILATVQGLIVLAGVFVLDGPAPSLGGFLLAACALFASAIAVLAIGLALAWRIDSIAGFHGVMNLVLLPGWLLSGALFPQESAAPWLGTIMLANPLLWVNRAIGGALGTMPPAGAFAWFITALFPVLAVLMLLASVRRSGGLRGSGEG